MHAKRTIGVVTFAVAYILQPSAFVGCASPEKEPTFTFGADEMQDLIAQANSGWEFDRGADVYRVDLQLDEKPLAEAGEPVHAVQRASPLMRRVHACGTTARMFTPVASACTTVYRTRAQVTGSAAVFRVDGTNETLVAEHEVSGVLTVDGLHIDRGAHITLALEDADFEMHLIKTSASEFVLEELTSEHL